jgi:L-ascorbate metabolism protein UlaG (beta-lactamase superfamily)
MASDTVPAAGGDIRITPIMHASLQIEHGGTVIHVDPWGRADYSRAKPADLILVTDIHSDHLDPDQIARIRKIGAPVVMPAAARDAVGDNVPAPTVIMANGDTRTIAGVSIEAVPMYNLARGPKPGDVFHPKGRGNGYIVTLGGKRLYIAGDTECTPEMKAVRNIDVAFVPMNLPYTMTASEAAEGVKALQPKIVYPYHYQGQNLEEFVEALMGQEIEVRLGAWYPAAPPGHQKRSAF